MSKWLFSSAEAGGNTTSACLVVSFFENQHVNEYLHASGAALEASDLAILEEYDRKIAGTHCFQHCGACLGSCPSNVPIHDVLRHRMYFEDYGDQKQAMQWYAKLEQDASACVTCNAPCTGACPARCTTFSGCPTATCCG